MKKRTIREMLLAKDRIECGQVAPARVWEVKSKGKAVFTRRALDPLTFQRSQKAKWKKNIGVTKP